MIFNMNILIIDDDLILYDLIKQMSLGAECDVYFSDDPANILSFIRNNHINVVIADMDKNQSMPVHLLSELKQFDSLLDVIAVGEPRPQESVFELINLGLSEFISKPVDAKALEQALKKIQKARTLRQDTFRLEKRLEKKYCYHGIIGKSPYMLEIYSLIDKISRYFTSVIITGETGTGKEMAARAIHERGQTKNRTMVLCDCVSIPENLFESELFGYVRGAFTGADKNKRGLFEEAHEGIIFLDEIGEIPLSIQAKLLRVLEYRQFRPLGSNITKNVDVKIIAATSRNLRDCVKKGTFREDLFHRLNRVELHLPPLRERREDIPLLISHFLQSFNQKFSKSIKGVSRAAQKLFQRYDWPGNIRELENVLESSCLLAQKDFIDSPELPKYLRDAPQTPNHFPFINRENLSTLDELEKEYIAYLLKFSGRNLKRTAGILNISRTTLYNKLKRYDIPH